MGFELVSIDEASFQLSPEHKKIWFMKGKKPKGVFFWANQKLTVFGALTESSKFHYEFYASQNTLTFCLFLQSLFKKLNRKKQYLLILDNASWHKTSTVKKVLEENKQWIKVEYLPPYSPELAAIELCWKITKNAVTRTRYFPSIDAMQTAIETFWKTQPFTHKLKTYLT